MTTKRFYIQTIGCQMNVYDSGQMAAALAGVGYTACDTPDRADLVLVNTCAVRAKAEQKAFSFLGRLARLKRRRPGLIVAVGGCVAQQEGEAILSRMPWVDLVFGTRAVGRLADLVTRIERTGRPIVDVAMSGGVSAAAAGAAPPRESGVSRFVTVMQGCDNFCTYCIVPHVRGREQSRPPEAIVGEVRDLVAAGAREITLLGQNVNSYGQKEGFPDFAELLVRVDAVPGLRRLRFTTSHPKDLSPGLMRAFADLETLCPHIHLPVQSGSDRILARMHRRYDRATYLARVAQLRRIRPGIAVTTDFIVGFPGESDADFTQTLDLMKTVRFDSLFAFMYSDRPGTRATALDDKVAEPEKNARLQELLALQQEITHDTHRGMVGRLTEVLVEGHARRAVRDDAEQPAQPPWSGRSPGNKIVNFSAAADVVPGRIVPVRIERALAHSLWGRATAPGRVRPVSAEGRSHAA